MLALPMCSRIDKAGGCCFENELLWSSLIIWSARQTGVPVVTAIGKICLLLFLFNGSDYSPNCTEAEGEKGNVCFTSDMSLWGKNTKIKPLRPQCLFHQLEVLFKENSLQALSIFMLRVYKDSRFALKVILISLVISMSSRRLGSLLIWVSQVTLACHLLRSHCQISQWNIFCQVSLYSVIPESALSHKGICRY